MKSGERKGGATVWRELAKGLLVTILVLGLGVLFIWYTTLRPKACRRMYRAQFSQIERYCRERGDYPADLNAEFESWLVGQMKDWQGNPMRYERTASGGFCMSTASFLENPSEAVTSWDNITEIMPDRPIHICEEEACGGHR